MPSKEELAPKTFLQADMEELVAAIKHNLHLKSRRRPSGVFSRHRLAPYAAPCRAKTNSDQHAPSTCKFCILKSSAGKDSCPEDPYDILNYLRKGILISEAVRRLQTSGGSKERDFYADDNDFCDFKNIESV